MLAYQMKGDGVPVVLVHAFPHDSRMWAPELGIFSRHARVMTPDLPGFGASALDGAVSIAKMAAEIAKLLDHLKISEPVMMGGLSMGGYVAFEFLRQFPRRLRGLGLFATRATADSPEAREKRFAAIEDIKKSGIEPFARASVKAQLGRTTQQTNPAAAESVLAMMKQASPAGTINALRAMADRRDSSDLLGSIRFPVLVAAGEEDTIIKTEEMRGIHSQIPGSEFQVIPKSGHLVNLENPGAFHPVLKNFLEEKILKAPALRS